MRVCTGGPMGNPEEGPMGSYGGPMGIYALKAL